MEKNITQLQAIKNLFDGLKSLNKTVGFELIEDKHFINLETLLYELESSNESINISKVEDFVNKIIHYDLLINEPFVIDLVLSKIIDSPHIEIEKNIVDDKIESIKISVKNICELIAECPVITDMQGDITIIEQNIIIINNNITTINNTIISIENHITNIDNSITNIDNSITNIYNIINEGGGTDGVSKVAHKTSPITKNIPIAIGVNEIILDDLEYVLEGATVDPNEPNSVLRRVVHCELFLTVDYGTLQSGQSTYGDSLGIDFIPDIAGDDIKIVTMPHNSKSVKINTSGIPAPPINTHPIVNHFVEAYFYGSTDVSKNRILKPVFGYNRASIGDAEIVSAHWLIHEWYEKSPHEDTTPLLVIDSTPQDNETDVEDDLETITIEFNQNFSDANPSSTQAPIILKNTQTGASQLVKRGDFTIAGDTLSFAITLPLDEGVKYEIAIFGRAFVASNGQRNGYTRLEFTVRAKQGKYIFQGTSAVRGDLFVYENNNGSNGALIETITYAQSDRWDRVMHYIEDVAICRNNVFDRWYSGSNHANSIDETPLILATGKDFNFAKCTTFGVPFMQEMKHNVPVRIPKATGIISGVSGPFMKGNTLFNQPITIPNGVTGLAYFLEDCTAFNSEIIIGNSVNTVTYFLNRCTAFNHNVVFPSSVQNLTYSLLGCTALSNTTGNKIIIQRENAFTTAANSNGFLGLLSATSNIITVRFERPQSIQTLQTTVGVTLPFRFRNTNTVIHNFVDLEIHKDSLYVDVANRTWAGHTFKSVTLI